MIAGQNQRDIPRLAEGTVSRAVLFISLALALTTFSAPANLVRGYASFAHSFDAASRITAIDVPGTADLSFSYNAAGDLVSSSVGGTPLSLDWTKTICCGTLLFRRFVLSTVGSRLLVAIKAERCAIRRSVAAAGFHGGSVMRFPRSPLAFEVVVAGKLLAATLASSLTATCAAPGAAYRLASFLQTTT